MDTNKRPVYKSVVTIQVEVLHFERIDQNGLEDAIKRKLYLILDAVSEDSYIERSYLNADILDSHTNQRLVHLPKRIVP